MTPPHGVYLVLSQLSGGCISTMGNASAKKLQVDSSDDIRSGITAHGRDGGKEHPQPDQYGALVILF